jgi:hypothetical protein
MANLSDSDDVIDINSVLCDEGDIDDAADLGILVNAMPENCRDLYNELSEKLKSVDRLLTSDKQASLTEVRAMRSMFDGLREKVGDNDAEAFADSLDVFKIYLDSAEDIVKRIAEAYSSVHPILMATEAQISTSIAASPGNETAKERKARRQLRVLQELLTSSALAGPMFVGVEYSVLLYARSILSEPSAEMMRVMKGSMPAVFLFYIDSLFALGQLLHAVNGEAYGQGLDYFIRKRAKATISD